MTEEMTKLIANIESESAQAAFESWMQLQWAEFYMRLAGGTAGALVVLVLISGLIYAIAKESKR